MTSQIAASKMLSIDYSTSQADIEARGHIYLNQTLELNNLDIFCSICPFRMFSLNMFMISTDIRLSRQALRPVCLYSAINQ